MTESLYDTLRRIDETHATDERSLEALYLDLAGEHNAENPGSPLPPLSEIRKEADGAWWYQMVAVQCLLRNLDCDDALHPYTGHPLVAYVLNGGDLTSRFADDIKQWDARKATYRELLGSATDMIAPSSGILGCLRTKKIPETVEYLNEKLHSYRERQRKWRT